MSLSATGNVFPLNLHIFWYVPSLEVIIILVSVYHIIYCVIALFDSIIICIMVWNEMFMMVLCMKSSIFSSKSLDCFPCYHAPRTVLSNF